MRRVLQVPLVALLVVPGLVAVGNENCSIGSIPTSINITNPYGLDHENGLYHEDGTLLLSNLSSDCSGSVNIWHFCVSVNADLKNRRGGGGGTNEHNYNVTFGIWRLDNATFKEVVLEEVQISPDVASLDVFCQRIKLKDRTFNISEGDVVGMLYSQSSWFNILVTSRDDGSGGQICAREVGGAVSACNSSQYSFYLRGYQDANFELSVTSSTLSEGTEYATGAPAVSSIPPFIYAVLAILVVIIGVAALIIALMFLRIHKMSHEKNFDISKKQPSSPRYVERGGIEVLENKIHRGTNDDGGHLNGGRQSSGTAHEMTYPGGIAVQDETITSVGMFSYPPPASRAPLPPLESSISSMDNSGITETDVRGLSGEQNQVCQSRDEAAGNGVPHYPLKISASVPTMPSVSVEEDKDTVAADLLYDNDVFETKPSRGSATPPVPAPRKATLKKTTSSKLQDTNNSNVIANPSTDQRQEEVKEKGVGEEKNTAGRKPAHDYVNVKHNVERLKSAPVNSDAPVYAEPMVTNQRTRIMSYNPGVSKTPPLPSRKPVKSRQRSISGGESSPLTLTHFFSNPPRSQDGSVSSNPGLDKIVESDEGSQDSAAPTALPFQPGEYLEPVSKKAKKKR